MDIPKTWRSPHGGALHLRPVRPDDARGLQALVAALGEADRRRRFHGAVKRLSGADLQRMTCIDPRQEAAFVVTSGTLLVADARAVADAAHGHAEFALMVAPAWRGQGIATHCLRALEDWAAATGVHRLQASVLPDNLPMLELLAQRGYACVPDFDDEASLCFQRTIAPAPWAALRSWREAVAPGARP